MTNYFEILDDENICDHCKHMVSNILTFPCKECENNGDPYQSILCFWSMQKNELIKTMSKNHAEEILG